jgi:ubiquinone biosynthesis protein
MPALRNAGKNLARLREISAIVARYGFGQAFDRARLFEALRFRPREADAPPRPATAERFRAMLAELGPTFVKFGQVLSSRADLLPPEWVRQLSTLQDNVPPLPIAEVREVIEKGLGKPVSQAFSAIDDEPLASASIGQVHAAKLLDGTEVVVKVQRPGIAERIDADLDLLYYLAQFLERVVEETGIYTPTGIVEEFERSLKAELDFENEAANIRVFRKNHENRPYMVIPRVYDELTSRTVLTMERLRGDKITNLDPAKHDRKVIAQHLVDGIFEQLFVDGVFHADPHPGNLFVLEGDRVGVVDFGLVGRVTRQMQETIIVLCLAIALKDPDTVARLLYKVGVPDDRVNLQQFRADIAEILDRYLGIELQKVKSTALVNDLLELALRYRIKVPKEYAVLTKAAITIEGVVRAIAPEMDVLQVALPYAQRLLISRVSPTNAQGGALRALLQAQGFMSEVPLQLSQILMDLEGGKFVVNMKSQDLPQLTAAVRWLGIVIFAGLTANALVAGAFAVLAAGTDWRVHGIPVLAIVGLMLAPMLFGGALLWTLLGGRVHKISLRRIFGKRS